MIKDDKLSFILPSFPYVWVGFLRKDRCIHVAQNVFR